MNEAACAELLWQSGFVWDAAAARSLRERHRLVGDAVGCIPGAQLPNACLACTALCLLELLRPARPQRVLRLQRRRRAPGHCCC